MTNGISPKVAWPAVALVAIGAALLVLGVVLGDDTMTKLGGGILAASGIAAPIGFKAPPGDVVKQPIGPASDDLLSEAAKKHLR